MINNYFRKYLDEGDGSGTPAPKIEPQAPAPKATPSLTPELVEMMESKIQAGIQKGLEERTPSLREEWKNEYETTQKQQRDEAQKAELLSKINSSEALKKQFESYGIDHTAEASSSLETYLKIFESKAKDNTVAPKGAPVTPSKPSLGNVDDNLKNAFEKLLGGK